MTRRAVVWVAGLALLAYGAGRAPGAEAAGYPERPIKFIVPWAAGGDTDSIVRVFANLYQTRPISGVLLFLSVASFVLAVYQHRRHLRREAPPQEEEVE